MRSLTVSECRGSAACSKDVRQGERGVAEDDGGHDQGLERMSRICPYLPLTEQAIHLSEVCPRCCLSMGASL